jgi:hypothetical protein
MSDQPWLRRADESARSYARFHAYLCLAPEERSIDEAFRRSLPGARDGTEVARGTPSRRAPGSWKRAAVEHDWMRRAAAYDDAEHERLRRARFKKLTAMLDRHQRAPEAAFGRSLRAMASAPTEGLTLAQSLACLDRSMEMERRSWGEVPELTVRSTTQASPFAEAAEAAPVGPDRFSYGPEVLLAVERLMAAHETKSHDEPDAVAPAEPAPPRPQATEPAGEPNDPLETTELEPSPS